MNGFVFLKNRLYLRCTETHTHTGHHARFDWVRDLSQATVFRYPLPRFQVFHSEIEGAVKLAAREVRTVVLEE